MSKKKNTLLILDETERSLVVQSWSNYINYNVEYKLIHKTDNKYHVNNEQLLSTLKSQSGGFILKITEHDMFNICEALRWNSRFLFSSKQKMLGGATNEYQDLAMVLELRDTNIFLFSDFDPKHYTLNNQLKLFKTFDFTQLRFILVRFQNNKMQYAKEFFREPSEDDEQYKERANSIVIEENKKMIENIKYNAIFSEMQFKAISFLEMENYNMTKDFSYHCL